MTVITICGSITKTPKPYWDSYAQQLTLSGNMVFMVNVWNLRDWLHDDKTGKQYKEMLDRLHKLKIARSDEVHVLIKDGYIGNSTRSEIAFAESLKIPVKYIDCDIEDTKFSELYSKIPPVCDMYDTPMCRYYQTRSVCHYKNTHNVLCLINKFTGLELSGDTNEN